MRDIVDEIRRRIKEVTAREQELIRREQELSQRSHHLDRSTPSNRIQELNAAQEHLEVRSTELNMQAVEITARRAKLAKLEERLAEREARLTEEQGVFERDRTELHTHSKAVRQQYERDRQILLNRINVVRKREQELDRRIKLARDQIVAERQEIERGREELSAQAAELEGRHNEVVARFEELKTRHADFERQIAEARAAEAALAAERTELDGRRALMQQRNRELDQRDANLARKTRELQEQLANVRTERESHERELDVRRRQVQHEAEEIAEQRARIGESLAKLEQQRQQLEDRERQIAGQFAALKTERLSLREAETAIERREQELDALRQRAAEIEREAEGHRESAAALRDQIDARDADSRQTALALEVEREHVERERRTLQNQIEAFDESKLQREQQFVETRVELARYAERLQKAEKSIAAVPQRWWLRLGAVAAVTGLAVMLLWLQLVPPRHLATTELQVTTEAPSAAEVFVEHRAALLSPDLFTAPNDDPTLVAAWAEAVAANRVRVTQVADGPGLTLGIVDANPERAAELARLAGRAYAAKVNAIAPQQQLPENYRELDLWRTSLAGEMNDIDAQRAALRGTISSLTAQTDYEAILTESAQLRSDQARIAKSLAEERARLTSLVADDIPQGHVAAGAEEKALAEDKVYQEDSKELRAEAMLYRSELTVSMLVFSDPARDFYKGLQKLAAAIEEQRSLGPPQSMTGLLEQIGADVATLEQRVGAFVEKWNNTTDVVQHMNVDRDTVEAAKLQTAAADGARQMTEDARSFVDALAARIDALDADSTGSTREVVVKAVLRGEVGALREPLAKLVETAPLTDVAQNFRLETHDRQLRGLKARLVQRSDAVRQELQLEADRVARQSRTAQIEQTRDKVRGLELERDQLVHALIDKTDQIRALDQEAVKRNRAETQLRELDARAIWLKNKSGLLDEKLGLLRRGGPLPDRIEIGREAVASLSKGRVAEAFGVGLLATAICGVFGLLLVARNPWRPQGAASGLLSAPTSA